MDVGAVVQAAAEYTVLDGDVATAACKMCSIGSGGGVAAGIGDYLDVVQQDILRFMPNHAHSGEAVYYDILQGHILALS